MERPLSGLERAGARASELDRELAAELGRPAPSAPPRTAGYLRELEGRERLTPAREHELVRAAQAGDADAQARLVEAFMPLIAATASTYRSSPTIDRLELVQEGVAGLLRALARFDPGRGVPFWAYATWWVRQAMQQLVAELTRPVVLSDRALRNLARLREANDALLAETGTEPRAEALAGRSGLDADQVGALLAADRAPRSLDAPVADADGAAVGTFGDLIADPLAEDAYEHALSAIDADELRALLSGLSRRERDVLRARYGDELSLRQIGARLGLTAEGVRRVEARALGKLRVAAGAE
jgi:RNA polymerase sigma factor (sigma-70 family)